MPEKSPLHLFEGYGVELEYMIVDRETFNVLPVCDEVLKAVSGRYIPEVEAGDLLWSNELVLHVIELKTNGPANSLDHVPALFRRDIRRINELLEPHGACLMPTAMHPWMNPYTETKLWPHEHNEIYQAYNRIFGCKGHGWSNLQSTHLNLPFANDEEFGRLHAAIRLALPILPALAASSPVVRWQLSGSLDTRLAYYQQNQRKIPEITGKVIPEPVFSEKDYQSQVLQNIYRKIARYDPEGFLQHEWLNSRGAIARFDRGAIEIRVLDIQENPYVDLAILSALIYLLKALVREKWVRYKDQRRWAVDPLAEIFFDTVKYGEAAVIDNPGYLEMFSYQGRKCTAAELWQFIIEMILPGGSEGARLWREALNIILEYGTLARRITRALGEPLDKYGIRNVYRELCDCLREGRMFLISVED